MVLGPRWDVQGRGYGRDSRERTLGGSRVTKHISKQFIFKCLFKILRIEILSSV